MSDSQENQACSVLHLEPPSHFLEQFSPVAARHKLHIVKRSQTINVSNKNTIIRICHILRTGVHCAVKMINT